MGCAVAALRAGSGMVAAHLAAALLLLATIPSAYAQAPGASVRLLDGGPREDGTHLAGLEIDLEPGWKTYWRMPGRSGLAPQLDFGGSGNVANVRVLWPAPHRLTDPYGDAIGYDRRVVLPVIVTPADAEDPASLEVTGLIGVCEKVCVPLDVDARLGLDPDATPGRIARFLDAVPRPATPEEAGGIEARRVADGSALIVASAAPVDDIFASGESVANGLSEPDGAERRIALLPDGPAEAAITLTVLRGGTAFTITLAP